MALRYFILISAAKFSRAVINIFFRECFFPVGWDRQRFVCGEYLEARKQEEQYAGWRNLLSFPVSSDDAKEGFQRLVFSEGKYCTKITQECVQEV